MNADLSQLKVRIVACLELLQQHAQIQRADRITASFLAGSLLHSSQKRPAAVSAMIGPPVFFNFFNSSAGLKMQDQNGHW